MKAWSAAVVFAACVVHPVFATEVWRLDNLTSIGGHDVKVVGAPRVIARDGIHALQFDGAHDGVFVLTNPIADTAAFTIELLFCPAPDGNEAQRFFHLEDKAARRALFELRMNKAGGWWLDEFLRPDPTPGKKGLTLIDPQRVHPAGRWYWLAMRCDGKRLTAFVNGRRELEGDTTFTGFDGGTVSLGVRQNLVYWFKGAIREVRFHREALADEKLQRVE